MKPTKGGQVKERPFNLSATEVTAAIAGNLGVLVRPVARYRGFSQQQNPENARCPFGSVGDRL